MASSNVASKLSALEGAPAQQRTEEYNKVLQGITSETENIENNLIAYFQAIIADNIGVINSRPLLSAFIEQYRQIPDNDVKTTVG